MSQNEAVFLGEKGGKMPVFEKEPNKRGQNKDNPRCLCEKMKSPFYWLWKKRKNETKNNTIFCLCYGYIMYMVSTLVL